MAWDDEAIFLVRMDVMQMNFAKRDDHVIALAFLRYLKIFASKMNESNATWPETKQLILAQLLDFSKPQVGARALKNGQFIHMFV